MSETAQQCQTFTLEDLGIVESTDFYGVKQLSLNLGRHETLGIAQGRAVFDPTSKKWSLTVTADSKFAGNVKPVWKRTEVDNNVTKTVRTSPSTSWTQFLPETEHVAEVLAVDWASTPLGAIETWPSTLQAYLNLVLADTQAAVIYWGPQLCAIYNQELMRLAAGRLNKGNELLGKPFIDMWPELWEDFRPMFDNLAATGTGIETLEVHLFPIINGMPEETFWSGSFLPVRGNDGTVQGFYNRARETTKQVVSDRLAKALGVMSAITNMAGESVFSHLVESLASDESDFPMVFAYSAHEESTGRCRLKLQCSSGLPAEGHKLVPQDAELYESLTGFLPYFRKAKALGHVLVLHTKDGSLPQALLDGFDWKGFGEPSRTLAIIPLATSDRLLGILVAGLNPRRPFDEDWSTFLTSLSRQASATVASAIDREQDRLRNERLTRQLADSERYIRDIAEYGIVGLVRIAASGKILWANDQFYEITGHGRNEEDQYQLSFLDVVYPEDIGIGVGIWETLTVKRQNTSMGVRLKKTWYPPSIDSESPKAEQVWVLASAYPQIEGDEVVSVASTVIDISRFKWAEAMQSKNAAAAEEAKRLQENFIDIVSHEMRNPLSAITQLSDGISMSMKRFESGHVNLDQARSILSSNVESANTILLCAAHQKRIIDDVLTLSKLDSMMLSITPVVVKPYRIVDSVLKMFEGEFSVHDIQVKSHQDDSYKRSKVEWVALDPSRLTQIFINLITNAIKFTKLEAKRQIKIKIGAVDKRPTSLAGVRWFPTKKTYKDLTQGPEWGDGEPVFICFEVEDTGRGLEQQEMTNLFGRFQQATAKTHIKYGGSGLGLFISRELTETQGGEIGVQSERGRGTVFAFYVKGRRAEPPDDPPQLFQSVKNKNEASKAYESDKSSGMVGSSGIPIRSKEVGSFASKASVKTERIYTILLVEDNIVNSQVLSKQLEQAHCEVVNANHGMEALDCLRRTRVWEGTQNESAALEFDVVLMDVEMPIMDGLTCTRRIRQLEAEGTIRKHINIICTTANTRSEQSEMVIQAGADDVLNKPFRVGECLESIKRVVQNSNKEEVDAVSREARRPDIGRAKSHGASSSNNQQRPTMGKRQASGYK